MKFLRPALLTLATTAALLSCNKKDNFTTATEPPGICGVGAPCGTDVVCTEEFAAVTLRIIRADSSAADLDSFQTTDLNGIPLTSASGGAVYGIVPSLPPGPGLLATLVNDLWVAGHQNYFIPVKARGWKSGVLLFNQDYVIGADCCHVHKSSGPDVIVVP